MAGVQAGTQAGVVYLEMVAEVTRLMADVQKVQKAVGDMSNGVVRDAKRAGDSLETMGGGFQRAGQQVTASAGAQRAGMQQLTMQIGDMATMYALGAKPMQIFASQSAQVIGAIQLMSGGTSKFAMFMGGPWGAAITAATLILAPFVATLFEAEKGLKAAEFASYGLKDAQGILGGVMDLTTGKINTQSDALHALAKAQALAMEVQARSRQADAAASIQQARDAQWYVEGGMGGGLSIGRRRGAAAGIVTQFQSGDLGAAETIDRLDQLREAGKLTTQTFLDLSAAVANFGVEGENIKVAEQLQKALEGDTGAINGFLKVNNKRTASLTESEKAARKAAEAYQRQFNESQGYIESLQQEVDEFGKSEKEVRLMEVARRMDAAATDEQRAAIQRLSDQREMGIGADKLAKEMEAAAKWRTDNIGAIEKEIALLGLEGDARELAALALEKEGFIAEAVKNHVLDAAAAWEEYHANQSALITGRSALDIERERVEALLGAMSSLRGAGPLGNILGALTSKDPTAALLGMGGIGTLLGLTTKGGQEAYTKQRQAIEDGLVAVFGEKAQGFAGTLAGALQGAGTGAAIGSILGGGKSAQLGATAGGALGGAFSSQIASAIGGALGTAAGAVVPIIGSLIGSALGSMLAKTPRGSATFGDSGLVSTRGNSRDRIGAATSAGNDALDLFYDLLDQLGATASGISFSTGIRKSNFTLDPTGQGRTKGAGVLNFGKDEEAFLKATLQEILSDATFDGLSEGFQRLLKGEGDIEKQLQKVFSLKGAFDDLAQRKDGQAFDLGELDKEFAKLRAIAEEAGEGLAQIEELYGLRRKEIVDKYAQEALEKTRAASELQIEIYTLEGKASEASALARKLELDAAEESLRPLLLRKYALQDEAAAIAQQMAFTAERNQLLNRYAQLVGDTEAIRRRELETVSAENKAILQAIYAREDLIAAEEAAAKVAEEAANRAKEIEQERLALQTQIDQLTGNTVAIRERERSALDESNRALYDRIEQLQAEAAETARLKAIADERDGLMTTWLQLIGDEASLRARALEKLDPSNRALQQQIWAYEDAQKAQEAAIEARKAEIDAIDDQIGALNGASQKWQDFAKDIRAFKAGLFAPSQGSGITYDKAYSEFRRVSSMAALGNEASLQQFTGVSQTFLESARANARSLVDYQRAIGLVAGAADAAAAGAEGVAQQAAQQIAILEQSKAELMAQTGLATLTTETLADISAKDIPAATDTLEAAIGDLRHELAGLRREASEAANNAMIGDVQIAGRLGNLESIWDRVTRGGAAMVVQTDGDTLSVAGAVTVGNTAANPVPVDQI